MHKRILTAVLGIPLLVIITLTGGTPLLFSLIIVASIGLYELYKAFETKDISINILLEILLGTFLLILMSKLQEFVLTYIILLFMLHFIYQIFAKTPSFESAILGFSGIIYVNLLIGHLLLFENITYGNYLIWLVFLIAFSTDTFAYFIGLSFGKRKLSPKISPKKSIEGSLGGILGSLLTCTMYGIYLNLATDINVSLFHFVILGAFTSIISQCGDLTASIIKRNCGIKDFGSIFPGHGGILDRFDSILFTAPIVYYYISIFL